MSTKVSVAAWVSSRPGGLTALACYLVARGWQLLMMGPPVGVADSPMYRSPDQVWLDFSAVSWDGQSLRPWPVTIVFALLPDDRVRILGQFIIATVAWGACIYQVGRLPVRSPLAVAASGCVAVLALTSGVTTFDVMILSESIALSLVAVFIAALLHSIRRHSPEGSPTVALLGSVLIMLASGWMVALIRPVLLGLLVVPVVVVVAHWWRQAQRRLLPVAAAVISVVLLSAVAMLNVVHYNKVQDLWWGVWRGYPGLNGRTIQQWDVIAAESSAFPELLAQFVAADGAPTCLQDRYRQPQPAIPAPVCQDGLAWISANFPRDLVTELAKHPGLAREYFRDGVEDASLERLDGTASLPTLVPGPISGLYFAGVKGVDLMGLWMLTGIAAVVVTMTMRLRGVLRAGLIAALLAAYGGFYGTVLLSPSDVSRVGLPVTVLMRVLLIVLVVLVLDAIIARRQQRGPEASAAPVGSGAPAHRAIPPPPSPSPGNDVVESTAPELPRRPQVRSREP